MTALFGFSSKLDVRDAATTLPDQPLYLPHELRTEMNWVDFSGASNPLGTPKSFLRAMHSALVDGELNYAPDRNARSFCVAVARRFGITADSVLAGTTVTSLMQAAAQTYQSCSVGIATPSPAEYVLAVTNAGHKAVKFSNPHTFVVPDINTAKRSEIGFEAAVLANPTYPTSRLLPRSTLEGYLEACKWVIVDESLIELTLGGESMVHLTRTYRNLVVVRSFSSSFAMPGVPISYCVAHPDTIKLIKGFYDSSGMSMFAEVLSDVALAEEEEYFEATREFLESEIPWMQCMLNLIPGIHISPAEANFVLCSFGNSESMDLAVGDTSELVLRLQLAGYLVRSLEGTAGLEGNRFFCVGLRSREDNEKLLAVLRDIIISK